MPLANARRYSPARVTEREGHAVVVGASMAGLLAARVLADAYTEVTVVDRDPLPDAPVARRGVPQADHAHLLLEAGRVTIEDLLPGYCEGLLAEGALLIDGGTDLKHYLGGDFLADASERIPMYAASRPLFEQQVRVRVGDTAGVELRGECSFVDYRVNDGAVAGVTVREDGAERELPADLVVDATGRTSRTPEWLADHGYASPPVTEVSVDITYSTARFERPADERWSLAMLPDAPRKRGWAVFPVEDGQWLVGLAGMHDVDPPTDPAGFAEYVAARPTAVGERFVAEHEFATDEIEPYPFPSSVRRHYERLDRFPEGLVVVGDAIASFNPIYGQGMSVAALESLALHDCLAAGHREDVAVPFFDRAEPIVDTAWTMAVGADFRFEATTGPQPTGLSVFNRYLDRLIEKAHADPELRTAFARVLQLELPPTSLLRPRILRRVLRPGTPAPTETVDPVALVSRSVGTETPADD